MLVPDGAPTVWVGRWQGFNKMQRVAGPDLMLEILGRKEFANRTHFLYGGNDGWPKNCVKDSRYAFPGCISLALIPPRFAT